MGTTASVRRRVFIYTILYDSSRAARLLHALRCDSAQTAPQLFLRHDRADASVLPTCLLRKLLLQRNPDKSSRHSAHMRVHRTHQPYRTGDLDLDLDGAASELVG